MTLSPELSTERDVLLNRAYLILKKFHVVRVELQPSSEPLPEPESLPEPKSRLEPESLGLAMLITLLFNPSRKEAVVTDLDSLKSSNVDVNNNASVHR